MGWVVLLALLVGCSFVPPGTRPDGDPPPDMDPNCTPWTTRGGHIPNVCATQPGDGWQVSDQIVVSTYNTDDGVYDQGPAPLSYLLDQDTSQNLKLRVISVRNFTVPQNVTLRVIGRHPLAVLSWESINVAGAIDVSSQRTFVDLGAGANRPGCDPGDPGQGDILAGGGGGGGNNQNGRNGGAGNQLNPPGNAGGTPGGSIPRLEGYLVGGCPGGAGGGTGGPGGAGGGAVLLAAKEAITIGGLARIHAGGMGGGGALGNGGGGGGGSGGFIGLDAPMVTAMDGAVLAANGGAGGAGCEVGMAGDGQSGQIANTPALGGMPGTCVNGTNGGNGGHRSAGPAVGVSSNFSGGGGGGGGGYIVIWAPAGGFTLVPGATLTPMQEHETTTETR
jgi:hypothetical protein